MADNAAAFAAAGKKYIESRKMCARVCTCATKGPELIVIGKSQKNKGLNDRLRWKGKGKKEMRRKEEQNIKR